MKRYSWASLIFMFLICSNSFGAIITVDNKYPYAGQYRTLQEAHDAATAGDSILVSPSLTPYNAITVTKTLSFLGVGFEMTNIIGGHFTQNTLISGTMFFNPGCAGSLIEGFEGEFMIEIGANNIIVKRNHLKALSSGNTTVSSIAIASGGSGSAIIQNKLSKPTSNANGLIKINATNIVVANNIIVNAYSSAYGGADGLSINGGDDILIKNNIIVHRDGGSIQVTNSYLVNNIIVEGYFPEANNSLGNIVRYCMYWYSGSGGIGNIYDIDMNTVFQDVTNSNFHLLPGSPAIASGEDGVDMGIYGGDAPYIDGGFPSLPSILQLKGDLVAAPGTGLNIDFKAKSNK